RTRSSPLFPYTTLFRSGVARAALRAPARAAATGPCRVLPRPPLRRRPGPPPRAGLGRRRARPGVGTLAPRPRPRGPAGGHGFPRSEEHTSELQSRENLV